MRIVAARDGGICRIKLPCGELSAGEALVLADAAERHASGVIEATNRANLQLRGVRAGQEAALIERLVSAGFGPSAALANPIHPAAAAADDIRNLMVSPTAGRDLHALVDTAALAARILALLQTDTRLHALSAKFALLLDGGERLAMLDHPHDVWLAAMQDTDGPWFAFGLAGCPPVAASEGRAGALAAVLPPQVPALVAALLHTFLDLAAPDDTRMRDLLAARPVEDVLRHVEARLDFPLLRGPRIDAWRRAPADTSLRLGAHPQRAAGRWHVGGQPPLGRLDAPMLCALAALARDMGNATLRLTPWQGVLLPDIAGDDVPSVLARIAELGLACRRDDPLTRLVACAGSAGCAKGAADTKADALRLAAQLPADAEVHLSGCPRSCAAAHRAPHTLLAVAPGRYDLYRRDDGPGFGQCVARHLTIEQAAGHLARPARSNPDA